MSRHPLLLLLFVLLLSACGESTSTSETTLRYSRWGLPEEIEAERELLKQFEAANPGIRVIVEYSSWSEYWNKLQAQMAAGSAPDVFLMGGTYVHDYAERGQLENLNALAAADESFSLDDYFARTNEVYTFDDGLWALPRDCNTLAVYYNKAIFDEAGVPYPEEGWTWDDLVEKARATTIDRDNDGRNETWGFLASFESLEVNWGTWVWQNGGAILNDDRTKCLLDQPEAVEALRFYTGLVLDEKVSPDTAEASRFGSNMFLTGTLAMSMEGSWRLRAASRIEDFEWGIAPLPRHKQAVAPVNGLGNSIYAKSKNKEAAWRLVRFLASETYQANLAKSGTSIPALKSVAESDVYLDGNPPGKELFLRQIDSGRTLPFTTGFAKWEDAIRGQLELVWLGRKDIDTALRDATVQVDAILAGNAAGEKQ